MELILKNKKISIAIIIVVVIVSAFLFLGIDSNQLNSSNEISVDTLINNDTHSSEFLIEEEKPEKELVQEAQTIFVDVKGAVVHHGVYEIEAGSRVKDIIQLAGGVTTSADMKFVNLAAILEDEMVLYVPEIGEVVDDVANLISTPKNEQDGKVSINKATVSELQTLPGIGETKANAIIEYRESNGPFKSVDDLLQITGIGEKTLEKFRDNISLN